ncbi:hypothetical protein ACQRCQ_10575 [Lachnospiraceae bacterium SGI.085]
MVLKKKAATGSMGYVVMFTMALLMVVLTLYMAQVARIMTHQHHVDDSLADSVLASLVADDIYYFETLEMTGTEMLTLMAENVYVSEVYDNAGKKITEDDGVATSFTVWVTPEEVESINTAVVYGGIQMYLKTE